jgi:hypothetical protein
MTRTTWKWNAAALGFVLATTSCAPVHSPRTIDDELGKIPSIAARVCVLRPESLAETTTMEVRDNGRLVGATRGRTFVCWLALPGEHQITSADDDTGPILLRAVAGAHYWLHQEVSMIAEGHAHLDWVDEATATEMLGACKARVRVKTPDYINEPDAVAVAPSR